MVFCSPYIILSRLFSGSFEGLTTDNPVKFITSLRRKGIVRLECLIGGVNRRGRPLTVEPYTGYDDNNGLIEHRAIGYSREGIRLVRAPYLNMSTVKAAGGLYSTVEDLFMWSQALDSEKLLSKKSLEAMFTIYKGDYGYGWHIDKQFNRRRANHGGVQIGFKTNIDRYLDDRVRIILLSNFDDAFINSASRDLAAIVFGEKYNLPKEHPSITLDPKVYDVYVGQYELGADFILTITIRRQQAHR